jgi:NADPH:quinone reductase-like Zn-dependent oxidoreductase
MSTQQILAGAHVEGRGAEEFAKPEIPDHYRAATVHKDEVEMFEGLASKDKDPRKSLRVEDVAVPELGLGESYVAVMASAINYNMRRSTPSTAAPTRCVVSNEEKAAIARSMGAEMIINRSEADLKFWKDPHTQDPKEWRRFGGMIRDPTGGEDIDIVFEHPGRETFGASVYVTRKGGTITTCASTSGYMHEYDNRYLWMNLKRIISSHFANYRESWEANRLIAKGKIHPTLSRTYSLDEVGQAALDVHQNAHQGKVGVLCLAPEEGLGVRDHEMRAQHVDAINRFRGV